MTRCCRSVTSLGLVLLVLTACEKTRLEASHQDQNAANNIATGVSYNLPMARFSVNISRQLADCSPVEFSDPRELANVAKNFIRIESTVSAELSEDPDQRYVIDYEKLRSWTKTSDITLEFHENGMIKSINTTAEDHTAAVITNVVKTGIGLAKIAAGVPGVPTVKGLVPERPKLRRLECTSEAAAALESYKKAVQAAKAESQALAAATKALADARAALEKAPDNAELKKKVAELAAKVEKSAKAAAESLEKKNRSAKAISASAIFHWPLKSDDVGPKTFLMNEETMTKWFQVSTEVGGGRFEVDPSDKPKIELPDLQVTLKLQPLGGGANPRRLTASEPLNCGTSPNEGLCYSEPATALFSVCKGPACPGEDQDRDAPAENILYQAVVRVPQLGRLAVLPFENSAFQHNHLEVSFSKDGHLEKFVFAEKKATGEVATGTLKDIVESLPKEIQAIRESDEAKELRRLELQTQIINKKRELLDAQAALQKSEQISDLAVETAVLNAEAELAKARQALDKATAKSP